MKVKYEDTTFKSASLKLIEDINEICNSYLQQGYQLTVRQCYYQLVAKAKIANNEKSYTKIKRLISDGRLAGLIDWQAIVDRTRYLRGGGYSYSPAQKIKELSAGFTVDKWQNQPKYVEVWCEKDALIDIVGCACENTTTRYLSCRGYSSLSMIRESAIRFNEQRQKKNKDCYLLYLGDHDPSGIDMTRDISERLKLFGAKVQVERIALTMEQIELLKPPPNPAKISDSRSPAYVEKYGQNSWELDAMPPSFIKDLIEAKIEGLLDFWLFVDSLKHENDCRAELTAIGNHYNNIIKQIKPVAEN